MLVTLPRQGEMMGALTPGDGGRPAVHPRVAARALGISRMGLRRSGMDRTFTRDELAELTAEPPDWLKQERNAAARVERAEAAACERRRQREQRELEFADAWVRAFKDRGDTDAWAARVLHDAGVHEIEIEPGVTVPVR